MKKLAGFLLVAVIAGAASGCVVRTRGTVHVAAPLVVVDAPPPPRPVVVEARPGFIWIEGRHAYRGGRYVWMDGRWEVDRAGHRWVQGRWERRGHGHIWVDGRWESHGGRDNGPNRRVVREPHR